MRLLRIRYPWKIRRSTTVQQQWYYISAHSMYYRGGLRGAIPLRRKQITFFTFFSFSWKNSPDNSTAIYNIRKMSARSVFRKAGNSTCVYHMTNKIVMCKKALTNYMCGSYTLLLLLNSSCGVARCTRCNIYNQDHHTESHRIVPLNHVHWRRKGLQECENRSQRIWCDQESCEYGHGCSRRTC